MVVCSYCQRCNQTIGHMHIPFQVSLRKGQKPDEIFVTLGVVRLCCKNSLMSGFIDQNLENYIKRLMK